MWMAMGTRRIGIIGAGGKTTALRLLAGRAGAGFSTLLTTTTHIYPVPPPESRALLVDPDGGELRSALSRPGVVCAGSRGPEGKLAPLPGPVLACGLECAQLVLYEGDGSRRHPLKLHRPGEPVILPGTDLCLVVAGLSALGCPVGEAVHRYDREPAWAAWPEGLVDAGVVLACVEETARSSGLPPERLRVLLNQADTPAGREQGEELARRVRALGLDCRAGSLKRDGGFLWDWLMPRG